MTLTWRIGDPTLADKQYDAAVVAETMTREPEETKPPEREAESEGAQAEEDEPSPAPPSFTASDFPVSCPMLAYLSRPFPAPSPLGDRARTGERLLYIGRLSPVRATQGVVGDLAAALAMVVDRRSRMRG